MLNSLRSKFNMFLKRKTVHPILAIVIAATYALAYYYDKNYALINSKSQFAFLVTLYMFLPILSYYVVDFIIERILKVEVQKTHLLVIFSCVTFFFTIVVSLHGLDSLMIISAIALGMLLGYVFRLHLMKVVVIQCLLALMVLPKLIPDVYREITYSKDWMKQPDDIEQAIFKRSPNIYLIQPDGYTSFSTLKDSIHNFDNSYFEEFLTENNFKIYNDYRSNYTSTLTSNSALFTMKHHYYGNTTLGINPRHNRRNEIVESNAVLKTFKHNNYKTFLLLEVPYLLSNRPDIGFDYCNMSLDDISYLSRGFNGDVNLSNDVKTVIKENKSTSKFLFIESMLPSHIVTNYTSDTTNETERVSYLKRVEEANIWLKDIIDFINKEDPNGIIIITADHGGCVGMNYFLESQVKTENELLINSIFSSLLAIKWPNNEAPQYDNQIQTSVNLFRILFTYLSENEVYLEHLQDDNSYAVIRKDAPIGVYEYIDKNGEAVFNKQ